MLHLAKAAATFLNACVAIIFNAAMIWLAATMIDAPEYWRTFSLANGAAMTLIVAGVRTTWKLAKVADYD